MPDGTDNENSPAEPTFEDSLSELQRIAADLESGALGLEESLARFEQGIGLLRKCNSILERAEQRIEILTGRDAEGNPTFAPFDATATVQAAPALPRAAEPTEEATPPRAPAPKGRTTATRVVVSERVTVESEVEPEEDNGPRLF